MKQLYTRVKLGGLFLLFAVTAISCSGDTTVYTLETSATPAEGGSVTPAAGDYEKGETVDVQATPNDNWTFSSWQGDITGSDNPVVVTMDSDKIFTALFTLKEYPLSITTQGEGSVQETVVETPAKDYEFGSVVELHAVADDGWTFVRWEGDLEGDENPQQITVDQEKQVTAVFEINAYTLTIDAIGEGTVDRNPFQGTYEHGTSVLLTANPRSGYQFDAWSGDAESDQLQVEVVMDMDKEITATFIAPFFLADNGVTIKCPTVGTGESGIVNGVEYTKRTKNMITPENASTSCTSGITDMSEMFNFNGSFNEDISHWDVSNVENMKWMFANANAFNQDIGQWDVSNVTNMNGMFSGSSFNQNIGQWDVSSATDIGYMFTLADAFNQDIGQWDVTNVENMERMFTHADAFNQDIGSWDVNNVTDMSYMFHDADAFNQDIGNWDVSNVTNMIGMFSNTDAFNQDIGVWDVNNVTDMSYMFANTTSFNQDIGSWDVSNATNMSSMFREATSFNQDIGQWNVSNATNMSLMFTNTTSFNQDIGSWDVNNVTDMSYMFYYATSFNQDIGQWNVSNVTNMERMFYEADVFNQDLSNWCVEKIAAEPSNFAGGSPLEDDHKPMWGTCPGD